MVAGPGTLPAQELPGPLVDAGWLAAELESPDLVVLQVGSREAYDAGHIPGARYLDLGLLAYSEGDREDPDHVRLELPSDLGTVRAALEAVGVSDGSRVVVTFAGNGVTSATRALWTLQYLGLGHRSALLDGGMEAWRASGGEIDTRSEPITVGRLTVAPHRDRIVDRDWVLANLKTPGIALVDARRREPYTGEREEFPGRAGHIPGAGNVPIESLFTDDGRFRPEGELRSLLEAAGVGEGDTVVAYCHIGLRASAALLAARIAGFDAVLYDGSMNEWARDPELPLEKGDGG